MWERWFPAQNSLLCSRRVGFSYIHPVCSHLDLSCTGKIHIKVAAAVSRTPRSYNSTGKWHWDLTISDWHCMIWQIDNFLGPIYVSSHISSSGSQKSLFSSYLKPDSSKSEVFYSYKAWIERERLAELRILSSSIIPHLSSLKWGIVGLGRSCIGWMACQNVDCARAILYELEKRFLIKTCFRWGFR